MMNKDFLNILQQVRNNSYVPDSGFSLAALAISDDNSVTTGVNWESHDRSIGTCGEMAAILNMISCNGPMPLKQIIFMGGNSGEENLDKTYCSCSACRQFMMEIDENNNAIVDTISVNGNVSESSLVIDSMPSPFLFRNYISISMKGDRCLSRVKPAPNVLRGIGRIGKEKEAWILEELLNAAHRSFVPDESYFQGAILITENNSAYCGSLFQTANFKSSKDAVTAALSMMISFDGVQPVKDLYFMHLENRSFAKDLNFIFPLNLLPFLWLLGTKQIYICSPKTVDRVINVESILNSVYGDLQQKPLLFPNASYNVPEKFRGLTPNI